MSALETGDGGPGEEGERDDFALGFDAGFTTACDMMQAQLDRLRRVVTGTGDPPSEHDRPGREDET